MKSARARDVSRGQAGSRSTDTLTQLSFVKTSKMNETSSTFWLRNAIHHHPWASSTPIIAIAPMKPPLIPPIRPKSYVPGPSS